MKKIKMLVVQYKVNYLKPGSNLIKFERIIKKYRDCKPDLVIFPEYSLTGPLYGHYSTAYKVDDPIFGKLEEIAQRYLVNIIPGSFVRKIGNRYFNSTCFISSCGEIVGFYDKRILWSSEKRFLTPGRLNGVFDTKIGRIAVQICADLNSPIISGAYKELKPDVIVNLAMWSNEDIRMAKKRVTNSIEKIQTETLMRARSLEARAYSIFCNYAGKINIKAETGRCYKESSIGNTMVINPYGEIISKTTDDREEALVVEIDLSRCHWANY